MKIQLLFPVNFKTLISDLPTLKTAILKNCDFSGSNFDSISFYSCKFPESKLSFLDFSNAKLSNCDFSNSIIQNAIFQKFKNASKNERTKFKGADLKFKGADLSYSVFVYAILTGVDFSQAKLQNVVFENCNLANANLTGANINGCGFNSSNTKGAILDMDGFLSFGRSHGFTLEIVSDK